MVRVLSGIAARMVALSMLATSITVAVGYGMYRVATYYRFEMLEGRLPPRARGELARLVRGGQRGSERYYELFDHYAGLGFGVGDLPFLLVIAAIAALIGGGVALILARRISRPIAAVAAAAARVSAGDRTVRVAPFGLRGEVGTLIDSFNRMAAEIEAYERERTVLTAGIAHELRTPLTILKGRLHGLADGVIDPAAGEADTLLRQVEQLSRLVEDLRLLAHADAGEMIVDRQDIDLADVLAPIVLDFRDAAQARNIVIAETYAKAVVLADPMRLTQVFTNILTNALKHAPDGSRVDVALFTAYGSAVATIIDEGEGFAPADERRIFLPFWRAPSNRAAKRLGSGLGLALAAKIAEIHDGRIVAKNRADRPGAIFCVWLPLAE